MPLGDKKSKRQIFVGIKDLKNKGSAIIDLLGQRPKEKWSKLELNSLKASSDVAIRAIIKDRQIRELDLGAFKVFKRG